jgi:prepilin-type N-terminal cleavage/methylation domain-containing protein
MIRNISHCNSQGFTLLELMVTMAIIAILTAFAIPQYEEYRRRAFDLRAQHDLYNVATAQEVYFMDNEEYLSCNDANCSQLPGISRLSDGVTINITATEDAFQGSASHPRGTGRVYQWNSSAGGLMP